MLDVLDDLLSPGLRIGKDLHGLMLVAQRSTEQALGDRRICLFLAFFKGAQ